MIFHGCHSNTKYKVEIFELSAIHEWCQHWWQHNLWIVFNYYLGWSPKRKGRLWNVTPISTHTCEVMPERSHKGCSLFLSFHSRILVSYRLAETSKLAKGQSSSNWSKSLWVKILTITINSLHSIRSPISCRPWWCQFRGAIQYFESITEILIIHNLIKYIRKISDFFPSCKFTQSFIMPAFWAYPLPLEIAEQNYFLGHKNTCSLLLDY